MTVKDPFFQQLKKVYGIFTLGFIGFVVVLGIGEYLDYPIKLLVMFIYLEP